MRELEELRIIKKLLEDIVTDEPIGDTDLVFGIALVDKMIKGKTSDCEHKNSNAIVGHECVDCGHVEIDAI
jgi:hypothetical protein